MRFICALAAFFLATAAAAPYSKRSLPSFPESYQNRRPTGGTPRRAPATPRPPAPPRGDTPPPPAPDGPAWGGSRAPDWERQRPPAQPKCEGGRVWNKCGSPCGDVACFAKLISSACMTVCEARCQCPQKKSIWDPEAKQCVRSNDECIIPDASTVKDIPLLPSPPKDDRSDQECLGDHGSNTAIAPLARQCPPATPKCVGGVCTKDITLLPSPPKDDRSGQECLGDHGKNIDIHGSIVPLARQCPRAKPLCIGRICLNHVDKGITRFCTDGEWLFKKPSKRRIKDCKWVGKKPHGRQGRCKKEDDRGTKAEKICMAACNLCV